MLGYSLLIQSSSLSEGVPLGSNLLKRDENTLYELLVILKYNSHYSKSCSMREDYLRPLQAICTTNRLFLYPNLPNMGKRRDSLQNRYTHQSSPPRPK